LIAGIYFTCFLASALLSIVATRWIRSYATEHGWVSKPELDRHIHTKSVPRLGGVAIFGSFMTVAGISLFVSKWIGFRPSIPAHTIATVFGAALIIFVLGLYDDFRVVGPHWKFAVQACAAIILYVGGVRVEQLDLFSVGHSLRTAVGLPVTMIWVLLITNAFNLIDGLDGLAAGSAFFSAAVLFVLSLFLSNSTVTLLSIALAGVILGFLRFNFHPASIFLGDSGSMFIGFILAVLALAGSEKAPTMVAVAIPVVSFGFPILDVTLAVARRFLSGKPLFSGDRDHIHHKLMKRGFSQRSAVLVLYGVTGIFALLSLVILHDAATIALVLTLIGLGVVLGVQYLGYAEFSELQGLLRRTAVRKRSVANNVEVRHAIEALNSCVDISRLCKILEGSLGAIGFDGFRLGIVLMETLPDVEICSYQLTKDGELQVFWDEGKKNQTIWELHLKLETKSQKCLGHLSLLRVGTESPLLVDLNLLSCDFRAALSQAVLRMTHGNRTRLLQPAQRKGLRTKAASSGSD
jgi:UDP-GlcNAc:undecaprenyl-phosphate GlcNAc-1-phosphate transferase